MIDESPIYPVFITFKTISKRAGAHSAWEENLHYHSGESSSQLIGQALPGQLTR